MDERALGGDFSPFFAAYPLPMMLFDRHDLSILDVNEAAVRQYGWSREEFLRLTVVDIRPSEDPERMRAILAREAEDLQSQHVSRHRRKDGSFLEVELTISDLTLAGRAVRLALLRDVTEARRAETMHGILAGAGAALARSLDLQATLQEVASLVVPTLADYCTAHLLGEDEILRQVVVAHRDPERERLLREAAALVARELTCPISAISRVARNGRAELIPAREDGLISGKGGEPLARVYRQLEPTCYVLAPLVGREGSIGTLMMAQAESGRRFGPADLQLATELGRRAGMALENAQLYRAAREELQQRQRAEAATRGAEERYRALFEQSLDGVCVLDLEGRFLEVNPAAARMLHRAPEDVPGLTLWDIVVPEQQERLRSELAPFLATGVGRGAVEYDIRLADGTALTVEVRNSIVRRDGVPYSLLTLVRDVTEQRRAEAARREAEERYKAVFEQSLDCIYVYDLEGRMLAMNGAARELLGYPPEEAAELTLTDLLVPEHHGVALERMRRRIAGEPQEEVRQYTVRRRDGSTRTVETRNSLVRRDGVPYVMVGVARDVTERRRAEEAASRLATVAEAAHEAIFGCDGEGLITSWNAGAERIFGCSAADVIGRDCDFLVQPAGLESAADIKRRVLAGERVQFATVVGEGRQVSMTCSPVRDRDGQVIGMGITAYDETERLALEARLRQAEKMEAIGRLAGGVAHDFNNILTGVKGHCAFIMDALAPADPRRAEAEEIDRAADRAATLTRQLLAFGRRQILQPRELRLGAAVTEMEGMLRRVIGEDIELTTRRTGEDGSVRADPGQLQQVILNLVVNARDAMPGGGRLLVAVDRVQLDGGGPDGLAPGSYMSLTVEDSGHGIDEKVLPHIFEPFFTTRPPGEGTGLGLATVYGIVTQSSGAITVVSRPGSTRFRVLLPEVPAGAAPQAPPRPPGARSSGNETILLLEDEQPVREVAGRALRAAGYNVLAARTGEEALALADRYRGTIHLLLSDVVLPGMSGPDVARELSQLRPGIRVLFVSGYAEELVLGRSDTGGAFLEKPFSPSVLRGKVREVLDAEASAG